MRALQAYLHARNAALIAARKELRIGELDARALLFIADNPGTRPTMLRDHLGITSAGVTTLIDRLIERDAVRRDVDPTDRRVNRISVTVDLAEPPWNLLTRFDREFDAAVGSEDQPTVEALAVVLQTLTAATNGHRR
jgi:DNA-binding MarR family transcriptional regulator